MKDGNLDLSDNILKTLKIFLQKQKYKQ